MNDNNDNADIRSKCRPGGTWEVKDPTLYSTYPTYSSAQMPPEETEGEEKEVLNSWSSSEMMQREKGGDREIRLSEIY